MQYLFYIISSKLLTLRQLIKPLVFFSFFCIVIQLSCETELFELDKLSNDTGLTPSVKLPVAKADIQLNSFLDRLDFNVDYERDDYATIYVSDTIQRLLETSIEDVYLDKDLNNYKVILILFDYLVV